MPRCPGDLCERRNARCRARHGAGGGFQHSPGAFGASFCLAMPRNAIEGRMPRSADAAEVGTRRRRRISAVPAAASAVRGGRGGRSGGRGVERELSGGARAALSPESRAGAWPGRRPGEGAENEWNLPQIRIGRSRAVHGATVHLHPRRPRRRRAAGSNMGNAGRCAARSPASPATERGPAHSSARLRDPGTCRGLPLGNGPRAQRWWPVDAPSSAGARRCTPCGELLDRCAPPRYRAGDGTANGGGQQDAK